jgi:hypothetical protein
MTRCTTVIVLPQDCVEMLRAGRRELRLIGELEVDEGAILEYLVRRHSGHYEDLIAHFSTVPPHGPAGPPIEDDDRVEVWRPLGGGNGA